MTAANSVPDDLDDLPLDDLRERAGPCDFHLLAARHDLV